MSKPAATSDPESAGKDLFRHAWSYAQKLDQAYKSGADVFHLDLIALRTKIKVKCEQILVLSCSQRRKAEEILWKKVFYDVISYCKQRKLFDPAHPLHSSCHTHLMTACMFYQHQLQWLPEQYGWDIMSCDPIQLEEKASTNTDLQWLLEACQRCLVYLGDIARYQIDLGGTHDEAAMYYQQAVVLDPTNGAPFNQLAVLAENKHHVMEAAYYYMRSITSLRPFPVSEANLKRLFDKNAKTLKALSDTEKRLTEPELRQHQAHSLQSSMVQLHNEFQSTKQSSSIPDLCARIMTSLEECLSADIASTGMQSGNEAALSSSRVLVLCGLSILPAYNLRLKGSKDTLAASAFALSVFSLLLDFSYQQLVALAAQQRNQPLLSSDKITEKEWSLLDVLAQADTPTVALTTDTSSDTSTTHTSSSPAGKKAISVPTNKSKTTGTPNKPRSSRLRRRRKRTVGSDDSSDDSSSESDAGSVESLEEEDDSSSKIASLSLSSSDTSDDEQTPPAPPVPQPSPRGRRNIQLAANFSASLTPSNSKTSAAVTKPSSSDTLKLNDQSHDDRQLAKLYQNTKQQETTHSACELVARCSLMGGVKVLTDWLQCYPTVIATYAKTSVTSVWSRLSELLNFLPSVEALRQAGLVECDDISAWTQSRALYEDLFLRGFAPLLRKQQTLKFPSASESINKELMTSQEQGVILILSLIKFGHYVANSKTTPVFEYDPSTDRFMGPVQRERKLAVAAAELKLKEEEKAWANRAKLMKAMAQQKLQSEVSALAAKTKAQRTKALFTPYLVPDATTLCTGLHLIKKLLKTEKFVVVIASSVIETLDQMKRGRESYAAREAIKFLERELHAGNRFIRAQKQGETANPDRKRSYKQELNTWLFSCLIDCAVYFNTSTSLSAATSDGGPLATLLLDRDIINAVNPSHHQRARQQPDQEVIDLAVTARQSGVELDTLVHFNKRWNKQS